MRHHRGSSNTQNVGYIPVLTDQRSSLEGNILKHDYTQLLSNPDIRHERADLYVTCQLWSDGKECTLPVRTSWKDCSRSYRCVRVSIITDDSWNHVVVLPVTYPSLLYSSRITFTIWDVQGAGKPVPIGGTTMRLFTRQR